MPAPLDAYDRLKDSMFRDYQVPADRSDEFLELQRRVEVILRRHASQWSLWRMRAPGEEWREFGPQFREEADVRAAADEFNAQPDLMETLSGFEIEPEQMGISSFVGTAQAGGDSVPREMVEQGTGVVWEVLVEIGESSGATDLPEIDQAQMTEAMRLAQSLASAIANRLVRVLPAEITVRAVQETLMVEDENGWGAQVSLVDLNLVEAAKETLGAVQEEATEALTVPWPHDPERGIGFHEPGAEIRDGVLHWYYGAQDDPVLVLDPIPLTEVHA